MSLWRGKYPLILASQSRARQALLANAGIEFEAVAAEIDERAVQQASSLSAPGDIAALLAREGAFGIDPPARQLCDRRGPDAGARDTAFLQAWQPRAGGGAITHACR